MAKTNYTKVEGSFDEGMRKMMVGNLLNEADAHQGKDVVAPGADKKRFLLAIHHELRYLQKKGLEPYSKLGILQRQIAEWLEHPETITEDDWKLIKGYKEGLDKLKSGMQGTASKAPEGANDALVNTERKKSVYKRFNINDKWLPLQ